MKKKLLKMKPGFRNKAREALKRAKEEFNSKEEERLKYCALELRLAIECVTYDLAKAYESDISPNQRSTWQPKKLLKILAEIDPHAAIGGEIKIGVEEELGKKPKVMKSLGKQEVFTLEDVKKHYDALGSLFLHTPTLKQLNEGNLKKAEELESRCKSIIDILEKVLSSSIFGFRFGRYQTFTCLKCEHEIKRHIPISFEKELRAVCYNCEATYTVTKESEDQYKWTADVETLDCQTEGCEGKFTIWHKDIRHGNNWTCNECNTRYEIVLTVQKAKSN